MEENKEIITPEIVENTEIVLKDQAIEDFLRRHPGPHTKLFASFDDVSLKIKRYLADMEEKQEPLTVSGLCIYLGCGRKTFHRSRVGEAIDVPLEVKELLEKTHDLIINSAEKRLYSKHTIAAIFHLCNLDPENFRQKSDGGGSQTQINNYNFGNILDKADKLLEEENK